MRHSFYKQSLPHLNLQKSPWPALQLYAGFLEFQCLNFVSLKPLGPACS